MSVVVLNLARLLALRGGPQHLPASRPLMLFLLSAYLLQNVLTGTQLEDPDAASKSLVAVAVQIAAVAALLRWRRHPARFVQTVTALAGVGIVFNAISWMILARLDASQAQPQLAMAWFAVFIWSLAVDAHIYRHALSVRLPVAMLITVVLLAVSYILIDLLFLGGS
ncbi:MAG: hypothetical protein PVF46_02260 [Lysobacterales bacterium]|jgi:hypothetical protein